MNQKKWKNLFRKTRYSKDFKGKRNKLTICTKPLSFLESGPASHKLKGIPIKQKNLAYCMMFGTRGIFNHDIFFDLINQLDCREKHHLSHASWPRNENIKTNVRKECCKLRRKNILACCSVDAFKMKN